MGAILGSPQIRDKEYSGKICDRSLLGKKRDAGQGFTGATLSEKSTLAGIKGPFITGLISCI